MSFKHPSRSACHRRLQGLGAFFAERLAASGARVAVAARRLSECERICARIHDAGGDRNALALDVTDSGSAESCDYRCGQHMGSSRYPREQCRRDRAPPTCSIKDEATAGSYRRHQFERRISRWTSRRPRHGRAQARRHHRQCRLDPKDCASLVRLPPIAPQRPV